MTYTMSPSGTARLLRWELSFGQSHLPGFHTV